MNRVHRALVMATCVLLAAVGTVLAPGLVGPASAGEHVGDGGFEAAVPPSFDSPSWTEADSAFGSPICNGSCGGMGPHAGQSWVWFGGTDVVGHTASVSQVVTIAPGTASLSFWYRNWAVSSPFTSTVTVRLDSAVIATFTEAPAPDAAYSLKSFDVSAFAGGSRTLSFRYDNVVAGDANFSIDDVSITSNPLPPDTALTGAPKPKVKTAKRKAKVAFSFSSPSAGATFECSLDGKAYVACESGSAFKAKVGKHTFAVRAVSAGLSDPTPATFAFKVKKKPKRA